MAAQEHEPSRPLSPRERAELSSRLEDLRTQLEEIARDRMRWYSPGPSRLLERSEELEAEADGIRRRLGMEPALGRPATFSWGGFLLLLGAIAVILTVIAAVTAQG
ncbi:MAG TPA: hypothetical protein VN241_05965 [Microbacterium sp.]|nr:hypothetical protein [Microbacterium sp.]